MMIRRIGFFSGNFFFDCFGCLFPIRLFPTSKIIEQLDTILHKCKQMEKHYIQINVYVVKPNIV